VDLDAMQVEHLHSANLESRKIGFVLESLSDVSGKLEQYELPTLSPYILDWKGVLGIIRTIRISSENPVDTEQIDNLMHSLETHLQKNGYATGIYTKSAY
jgi:hypothetical protein